MLPVCNCHIVKHCDKTAQCTARFSVWIPDMQMKHLTALMRTLLFMVIP